VPRIHQQGFVLVVTLWILAIITIGAGYFAERVAGSINLARQSREATEALLDIANTRAEILFRLGTTYFSIYGLGPMRDSAIVLDNRPYRGSGQGIVRLQDSRGLINVNFIQPEMLLRLLGQMGVPAEKRLAMLDTLNDYTDTDDLRRLNGAESVEYQAQGLPLPPNDWLVTPWQLQNIIGWREQAALWKDQRFPAIVTTARVGGFNPNTAPREVLAALPGSSPELADKLMQARALNPFYNDLQMNAVAGQAMLDPESLIFYSGDSIRLSFESDKIPWALRYQVTLTPFADHAPWRIDYYIKTGVTSPVQNADKPLPLPARIALPASADAAL
jgi:DNA uptake protein ComE-like DNA-binding protein